MPAPASSSESIALLIDADNAPAAKIEFIIAELATYGAVNVRRAYGNWKKETRSGWENVLHEYAIQPVQHFDLTKGKNATDMGLVIGAMDILYTKNVTTFGIVSSDCDFTPLVVRLKEEGKQVIGFGGQKTPLPFIHSCTRFLYLDEDKKTKETRRQAVANPQQLKTNSKLINRLRQAVRASENEDGWAALTAIRSHISNQGSFDPRNYGYAKLRTLMAAIDLFEMKSSPQGTETVYWVRDRQRAQKIAARSPEPPPLRPAPAPEG